MTGSLAEQGGARAQVGPAAHRYLSAKVIAETQDPGWEQLLMTQTVANTTAAAPGGPGGTGPGGAGGAERAIQAAVGEISQIATLPEVTFRIIRLVEDPDSTAQDLNHVISNDPALGARILKVVNSAFYGLPGQIGSINRAIVLLGLNAVKNIAIAASLAKLFRGGQISRSFNARDLWTHSIGVATATKLLATKIDLGLPDEAFLAGLMHDVGIMVEIQARRMQFIQAVERLEHDSTLTLRRAERTFLGADHQQFGEALCRAWKFPASFSFVTGHHHEPWDLPADSRILASLVYVSDIAVAASGVGFRRSVDRYEISAEVMQELNLTLADVEDMCSRLPEAMKEAANLLQD
jgi:HD-like signal output (HDOD) protein